MIFPQKAYYCVMNDLIDYSYILKVEVLDELPGAKYKKSSYRCKFTNDFVFKGSKVNDRNDDGRIFSCSKPMIVFCDENASNKLKEMFQKSVDYTSLLIKDNERFIEDYSNKIQRSKENNLSYKNDLLLIEELIKSL